MAFTITSYTPTTGPASGNTLVTVTGTGLAVVETVLVGGVEATIVGTPGATSLQFRTPAHAAGSVTVTLLDADGSETHNATAPFVYTAVTVAETLVSTLAGKMALDVRHVGDDDTEWVRVRGVTTIKDGRDFTTEDDSDTDSGIDTESLVTGRSRSITGTVKRGRGVSSGNYDPGQEIIRIAADHQGTPSGTIEYRIYDRTGGPEAYQGASLSQWSPQGGNKTGDKVDFTLPVQGSVATIPNPVIATPSLAGPYGG